MRAIRTVVVVVVFSVFVSLLPTPLDPTVWHDPAPLLALDGAYAPGWYNSLATAEHLHSVSLSTIAPESLAFGGSGEIYASLGDGRVVRMRADGSNPVTVFFSGGFVASDTDLNGGNGVENSTHNLMRRCMLKAREGGLHTSRDDELRCGRPLGLRFRRRRGGDGDGDEPVLYIADAYHGVFRLDGLGGKAPPTATQLINSRSVTVNAVGNDPDVRKRMLFVNDIDVAESGVIYLTDSSWKHPRAANRPEVLDGAPRGRLLRFDPDAPPEEALTVLACGLHFPNGVQLVPDSGDSQLLVVESTRFRVLRFDLDGANAAASACLPPGETPNGGGSPTTPNALRCDERADLPPHASLFADLPGFPDNIRYTDRGVYFVGLGTKSARPFSLLHLGYSRFGSPLRSVIGKLVPMEKIEKLVPQYGLVAVLGVNGTAIGSFHDPSGRTPFISEAQVHPDTGHLYMGSHSNRFLARVKSIHPSAYK